MVWQKRRWNAIREVTMKIGIVGCGGRMGRMLITQVVATEGCELAGGTVTPGSLLIGQDIAAQAGFTGGSAAIVNDAAELFGTVDAVIDFTMPAATVAHALLAAEHGTVLVIGTTGLSAEQQGTIVAASKKTAVLQSANMSLGINLLLALTKQVSGILGMEYDIEVVEMHHRHKVDAPSGTALALGRAAANGRAVELDDVSQRVRDGHTGARRRGDIGFATLRGGDVAGEHSVIFAADGERIELTHKASSRAVYAAGAIRGALWAQGKPPGLYSMLDVLGFG
jgi:4-hydroxy-tetrahydrodipicolinate reductase